MLAAHQLVCRLDMQALSFPEALTHTHTHTFIHAAAAAASLQGEQRPTSTNAPENLHLLSYIDCEYKKVTVNI